jgi:hypothetical protein
MINDLTKFNLVKLNKLDWKESVCSCYYWLKSRKCYHIVGSAYRVKLCDFSDICMDQVIEPNRKRGAPLKNKPALMVQPSDLAIAKRKKDILVDGEVTSDEETSAAELLTQAKKRVAKRQKKVTSINDLVSDEENEEQDVEQEVIATYNLPTQKAKNKSVVECTPCDKCGTMKVKTSRWPSCPNGCTKKK